MLAPSPLSQRVEELLLAVKDSLRQPDTCMVLPLDLSKHENASQWTREALAFKGRIDILVNNGGIGHLGRVEDMDFQVERRVLEVNFWASVALTKAMLPTMLERRSGKSGPCKYSCLLRQIRNSQPSCK